jgi:osmotically inducible protein OsmC
MAVRKAEAVWEGDLRGGHGTMRFGSRAYEGSYSFSSRFEESPGTNPEELIAAAHAGCFSMALSARLSSAGHSPERIQTVARVHLDKVGDGFKITLIELQTEAKVPGIGEQEFQTEADAAKQGCPVSQALAGAQITLQARLVA